MGLFLMNYSIENWKKLKTCATPMHIQLLILSATILFHSAAWMLTKILKKKPSIRFWLYILLTISLESIIAFPMTLVSFIRSRTCMNLGFAFFLLLMLTIINIILYILIIISLKVWCMYRGVKSQINFYFKNFDEVYQNVINGTEQVDKFVEQNKEIIDNFPISPKEKIILKKAYSEVCILKEYNEELVDENGDRDNSDNSDNSDDENDKEYICNVCMRYLDYGDSIIKHPGCNHIYHTDCLIKWLESRMFCPKCKIGTRTNLIKFFIKKRRYFYN